MFGVQAYEFRCSIGRDHQAMGLSMFSYHARMEASWEKNGIQTFIFQFVIYGFFLKCFWKKNYFFICFKLLFFNIFRLFWYVNIKNNFLKNKYYFNIFLNKKYFFKKKLLYFYSPHILIMVNGSRVSNVIISHQNLNLINKTQSVNHLCFS
jgi:hypothetical protein